MRETLSFGTSTTVQEIRSYLELNVEMRKRGGDKGDFAYWGIEDFILQHGQAFAPRLRPRGYKVGTPKSCFRNATLLAIKDPSLTYVEGFAAGVIPVHHAWCVDSDDQVIEVTWSTKGALRPDITGYWGVKFPAEIVELSSLLSKYYGVLTSWDGLLLKHPYTPMSAARYLRDLWKERTEDARPQKRRRKSSES